MYSIKLINTHFWLHTIGVVLYIVAMWISGIMQGMMWRAVRHRRYSDLQLCTKLRSLLPFYLMRFIGGCFVVTGMLVMAYNVVKTIRAKDGAGTSS